MRTIPLLVPDMPPAEALRPYLERMDAARWYTNFGPLVQELEARLARYFGPGLHVATVSNCTAGLELALWSLGLEKGARVLIPGLTFVATAAAVVRAGYEPVISDVEPRTWLLTPGIARDAMAASRIAAVMPVSTYGCAQDTEAWDAFADETGLPVIVDAAGAFGNQPAGRRTSLVFSLHATKSLGAGEGGFLVSPDAALLARFRELANFGIGLEDGLVRVPGTNAKLSEYHAAAALASLDRWDERAAVRIAMHASYTEILRARCPDVQLQRRPVNGIYSILPVLLPAGVMAAEVAGRLATSGVETRRWYCPTVENHPGFSQAALPSGAAVLATLTNRLLALPFHPFLSEQDVGAVVRELAQALPDKALKGRATS